MLKVLGIALFVLAIIDTFTSGSATQIGDECYACIIAIAFLVLGEQFRYSSGD